MIQLNEAIKLRLSQLMMESNLSNYRLSCKAGLNPSQLNDFTRGRISYPRIDTLYLWCEALGITLDTFFKDPLFNRENIELKDDKD